MCELHFAKSFVTQLTPSDISNSDVQDSNSLLTTIEFFIYLKKGTCQSKFYIINLYKILLTNTLRVFI